MNTDLCVHRARIGRFNGAANKYRHVVLKSKYHVLSFLSLCLLRNKCRIQCAIFILLFSGILELDKIKHRNPRTTALSDNCTVAFNYDNVHIWLNKLISLLLIRSGDVETNPGPTSELKVIHLNARSIPKNKHLIEAQSNEYDIITCSETWFNATHQSQDTDLVNFHSPVRLDRPGQAGGGVAIYAKSHLYCKHRPDLHVPNLEAIWVETKINNDILLIGSYYRPPSSAVEYWNLISESLRKVNNSGCKYVVLGDLNTDFNLPSKHLADIMNMYKLHQLVNSDTRITATSSTRIDLILTQSPQIVQHVEVLPEICSDHCVPCATIRLTHNSSNTYKRTLYKYEQLDHEEFNRQLTQVNWLSIVDSNPIDYCVEEFSNTFFGIACKCMPVKTVTIRPRDAVWLNNDIRRALKNRYKLFKRAKLSKRNEDWVTYRQYRNTVTNMIRDRKLEYLTELDIRVSDPAQFGQKDWWKFVKQFMNKKGISEDIPPLLHNGIVYSSSEEKATLFNEYFIKQSTLDSPDGAVPDLINLNCELNNIIFSSTEIKAVIINLDSNKAVGPDKIHNKLLTAAVDIISEPLAILFNRCIAEGIFPSTWKIAHVNPIHKKGPTENCANYRPISLLSCVGKVLERCIHSHVFNYLQNNHILTPSQSGFISGDSAVNQLLAIYNDTCLAYDRGITNQSIFFDISKAFDRVWHKGLLKKT